MSTEPIDVVAAVILRDGRYLVGRRPRSKRHGGLWEFPGGKVRTGESWRDALDRELREELDLRASHVGAALASLHDPGSPFLIHFVQTAVEGRPRPLEHDELRWGRPESLASLALAPSDARFVHEVLLGGRGLDTGS